LAAVLQPHSLAYPFYYNDNKGLASGAFLSTIAAARRVVNGFAELLAMVLWLLG
jgi:hypothetical protein